MGVMQEVMSFGSLNHSEPSRIIRYFQIYLIDDINPLIDAKGFAGYCLFVATNQFTTAWSQNIFYSVLNSPLRRSVASKELKAKTGI